MATHGIAALGGETFLRLLTTQLRFQNPLDPMSNTEFIAQLAQFSQLEQTNALNNKLERSVDYMASLNNYGAAGLIGKNVLVEGGGVTLAEGGTASLVYNLEEGAERVTLQIFDKFSKPVRTEFYGSQSAGVQSVTWDGRDDNGTPLPSGEYTYSVTASGADLSPVKATSYAQGEVTGVSLEDGIAYLLVNGQRIAASGVLQITR